MGLVLTADWAKDTRDRDGDRQSQGVTLAQLGETVERAMRECSERGIDPATVEPKTLNRLGGRIRKLTIEV